LKILKEALKYAPNVSFEADILNNIGVFLLINNNIEECIEYFKMSLIKDSSLMLAYHNLVLAHLLKSEINLAKLEIDKLENLSQGVDKGYKYRNLGVYYYLTGDIENAKNNFEKGILETTQYEILLIDFYYAKFLYETGYPLKAKEYFEKSLKQNIFEAKKWLQTYE